MSETKTKGEAKEKKSAASGEVTFKCRLCEKQKPIIEMRILRRFRPVIAVCRDCERSFQ